MRRFLLLSLSFSISAFFIVNCSSGSHLTPQEKSKLDPALQKLVETGEGRANQYDVNLMPDGTRIYGVIIRTNNMQELRKAGIQVNSVFGDIATARLTIKELVKVAKIPSVQSIQNSSKNYPSKQ